MVLLAEALLSERVELTIFDLQLEMTRSTGANQSLATATLPQLERLRHEDVGDAIRDAE